MIQMVTTTIAQARNFGAKAAAIPAAAGALVLSNPAFAQATDHAATITAEVNSNLEKGALIAAAVVTGLFAIWGIKLLLKGK